MKININFPFQISLFNKELKRNEDNCKEQERKDGKERIDHQSCKKNADIRKYFPKSSIENTKKTKRIEDDQSLESKLLEKIIVGKK